MSEAIKPTERRREEKGERKTIKLKEETVMSKRDRKIKKKEGRRNLAMRSKSEDNESELDRNANEKKKETVILRAKNETGLDQKRNEREKLIFYLLECPAPFLFTDTIIVLSRSLPIFFSLLFRLNRNLKTLEIYFFPFKNGGICGC